MFINFSNFFLGGLNLTVLYTSPNRCMYGVGSKAGGGSTTLLAYLHKGGGACSAVGPKATHNLRRDQSSCCALYRLAAASCGQWGGGVHAPLGGVLGRGPHCGRRQGVSASLLQRFRCISSMQLQFFIFVGHLPFFVHLRSYIVRAFWVQLESSSHISFIALCCSNFPSYTPIPFLSTQVPSNCFLNIFSLQL